MFHVKPSGRRRMVSRETFGFGVQRCADFISHPPRVRDSAPTLGARFIASFRHQRRIAHRGSRRALVTSEPKLIPPSPMARGESPPSILEPSRADCSESNAGPDEQSSSPIPATKPGLRRSPQFKSSRSSFPGTESRRKRPLPIPRPAPTFAMVPRPALAKSRSLISPMASPRPTGRDLGAPASIHPNRPSSAAQRGRVTTVVALAKRQPQAPLSLPGSALSRPERVRVSPLSGVPSPSRVYALAACLILFLLLTRNALAPP